MLCGMRKLFSVLADSLMIWSRNFTLIYVLLFSSLLFELLIPRNESPALEPRWFLLAGVMLLLFGAVMAGLYRMVALACDRFLGQPREQALRQASPKDALTLFQAFLPGISQSMFPIVGGYLVQLLMAVLLLLPTQPLLMKYLPMLQKMLPMGTNERMNLLLALPVAQQDELSALFLMLLVGMAVFALFGLMTILWPAFVVYYRNNPLKACARSMLQFFKDPLTMIGLVVVLIGIRIPLFLLNSVGVGSGNYLISMLVTLMALFVEIFIAIAVFVYVYQAVGKPIVDPDPSKGSPLQEQGEKSEERFED